MEEQHTNPGWELAVKSVQREVEAWRAAHPQATFDELEQAVEERLAPVRAHLLRECGSDEPERRPTCPQCGQVLQARGQQERTLVVRGNQPVRLRRTYAVCPGCGTGLFPPR